MRQIDALTGVRGLAAWLVVLFHIREGLAYALPAWTMAVLAKGYLAVDLFFVLSGFVLWLTWGQRFAEQGWTAAQPFMRKRIARVWPLHLVVLAATVAFATVLAATGRTLPPHYRWDELPLHILLMQNWGFTNALAWNDPSWSISTELAAYLAFAALLAWGRLRVGKGDVWLALLAVVALDRLYGWNGSAILGDHIASLGLARCLVEFGCGVAICRVWQRHGDAVVGPAAVVVVTGTALWASGLARETLTLPIVFAALVALLAATSAWRGNPLSSRIAVALGDVSYSTYLIHFLGWTVFKIAFVPDPARVPLATAALFLLLVLVASFVSYRVIERPGQRLFAVDPDRNPIAA